MMPSRRYRKPRQDQIIMSLRVPADLHRWMVEQADANERTIAGQLLFMLKRQRQIIEADWKGGDGVAHPTLVS